LDAGPVLLRKGVFLTGGRTRGYKAIGGVVGRSNPAQSLGTKIAAANFKLNSTAQFGNPVVVVLGGALPFMALSVIRDLTAIWSLARNRRH
jgi:hypothetical protein